MAQRSRAAGRALGAGLLAALACAAPAAADPRERAGGATGGVLYECEGLGAVLSAEFAEGGSPRVTLRWSTRRLELEGVPSGSGARYASGDGTALFWAKGDEAVFAPGDGPEYPCVRVAAG